MARGSFATLARLVNKGMPEDQAALVKLADDVSEFFAIPAEPSFLVNLETAASRAPMPLATSVQAFCANLRSIISTTGLPFTLALVASHQRRFTLFQCAAEIEAIRTDLFPDRQDPVVRAAKARTDASRRTKELAESSAGRDSMNHDACTLLLDLVGSTDVRDASRLLVQQGAVLVWSAFEALSRDVFRDHLNATPKACSKLFADPNVRKRFDLTRVSIERVADFDFDLSKRLGDLLIEQNDLADLPGIKAILAALFPEAEPLRRSLDETELWRLFQRRNLIVHRQGIVDRRYLDATGDYQQLGVRLSLKPDELHRYIQVVGTAAAELLNAAMASGN